MGYGKRGRVRGGSRPDTDTIRIGRPDAGTRASGRGTWREVMVAEAITFPIIVGLVHWLVVQVAASLAFRYGTSNSTASPPYQSVLGDPPSLTGLAHTLVEPLRNWDGTWYRLIAEHGYGPIQVDGAIYSMEARAAFWPLFPWLMDWGGRLTGWQVETVGYLIANLSFFSALILLYRLVALDFDRAVARRTLWIIALFPTAFFFSAVYTESLFLLLAVGALLAARVGNWWLAGIVGVLAALTRSYGVLLLLPFAVLFIQQHGFSVRRWFPNAIPAALPALGPVIFGWHLERAGRTWRDFIDVQEQWNRYQAMPWETLRCGFVGCYRIPGINDGADWGWIGELLRNPGWSTFTSPSWRDWVAQSDTLELVATLVFLALAAIGLKYLPLYQSVYLIPGLLIPLFSPSEVHALMSMPRFGLTLFPLFVMLALLIKSPRVGIPAAAISTVLLILLTIQFSHWYWVS